MSFRRCLLVVTSRGSRIGAVIGYLYALDAEKEELVDLLSNYATSRYSYRTLAEQLNMRGHRARNSRPFTASSIENVLTNRFYEGKVVYHPDRPDEQVRDGEH